MERMPCRHEQEANENQPAQIVVRKKGKQSAENGVLVGPTIYLGEARIRLVRR